MSQAADGVVIKDVSQHETKVPAGEIEKLTQQKVSLMPEGLLGSLTAQQAADLIAYLESQK